MCLAHHLAHRIWWYHLLKSAVPPCRGSLSTSANALNTITLIATCSCLGLVSSPIILFKGVGRSMTLCVMFGLVSASAMHCDAIPSKASVSTSISFSLMKSFTAGTTSPLGFVRSGLPCLSGLGPVKSATLRLSSDPSLATEFCDTSRNGSVLGPSDSE